MSDHQEFVDKLNHFFECRDWKQFHSPKNLVMALSSEVGELADHFRWLSEQESFDPPNRAEVKDEIGDAYIMLGYLADRLGIDLLEAGRDKLHKIESRYPESLSRGKRLKYTAYPDQA